MSGGSSPVGFVKAEAGPASSTGVEPTRHWFVVADADATPPELKLISVRKDDKIDAFSLPVAEDERLEGVRFSESGDKLCYTTSADWNSRVWVVRTEEKAFHVQSWTLPEYAQSGRFGCGWASEDVLVLDGWFLSEPNSPILFGPFYLQLTADARIPEIGSGVARSPDGKFELLHLAYDSYGRRIAVKRVNSEGGSSDVLLSLSGVQSWLWSKNSQRLALTLETSLSGDTLIVYDFSGGSATRCAQLGPGKGAYVAQDFSPDGKYLLVHEQRASGSGMYVWDAAANVEALVNASPDFTPVMSLSWLDNSRLISSVPTLLLAQVDAANLASGRIVAEPIVDREGTPIGSIEAFAAVTETLWIGVRAATSGRVVQTFELVGNQVLTTDLLPGTLGSATPGAVSTPTSLVPAGRAIIASSPSYYYVEFAKSAVSRSIRLDEYLSADYVPLTSFGVPGGVALIVHSWAQKSYAWLSLEHTQPGPLLPIPARITSENTLLFPEHWPR
ncbi:MAG: hypothetical protein ACM3ZE_00285 [Myxococcales bacterium]